jgi:small subunit ribosomal protein S6
MKEGTIGMELKNNYEGLFIIRPELKEEEVKAVYKSILDSITNNKGEIAKEEDWGKRVLAYEIKKRKEGFYYKVNFQAPSLAIAKMRGGYRLDANILRVMITRR